MTAKLEIWVANVPTREIANVLTHHVDGFTIANVDGYWQGEREDATYVTVIGAAPHADIVASVTELACRVWDEDAILFAITNEWGYHAQLASWNHDWNTIRTEKVT
jgi:hypothetical protein